MGRHLTAVYLYLRLVTSGANHMDWPLTSGTHSSRRMLSRPELTDEGRIRSISSTLAPWVKSSPQEWLRSTVAISMVLLLSNSPTWPGSAKCRLISLCTTARMCATPCATIYTCTTPAKATMTFSPARHTQRLVAPSPITLTMTIRPLIKVSGFAIWVTDQP